MRPSSEWQKHERKASDSGIRAECIRKRNRNSIYKIEQVQNFENMLKVIDDTSVNF